MAAIENCIQVLRRRIGDTEEPYTFSDELLTGYIDDAVAQVELEWNRGITCSFGVFNVEITPQDVVLFTTMAHYLVKLRTKDKADRDNFLMKKGRLTLDNTNQAGDHMQTLEILMKEYKRVLFQARNGSGSIKGVRVE